MKTIFLHQVAAPRIDEASALIDDFPHECQVHAIVQKKGYGNATQPLGSSANSR